MKLRGKNYKPDRVKNVSFYLLDESQHVSSSNQIKILKPYQISDEWIRTHWKYLE